MYILDKKIVRFFVLICIITFGLMPHAAQAKTDDEQNQIILLNDAASALEDNNPQLSNELSKFADEREKDWEAKNASKTPMANPGVNEAQVQEQIKLINTAVLAIGSTYPLVSQALDKMADMLAMQGVTVGTQEGDLLALYPQMKLRNFRHDGAYDWLTYNVPLDDPFYKLVTFYFQNNELIQWKFNDRPEVVKEYLSEFCFYQDPNPIYVAIKDVLERMPYEDFLSVTRRERPMLFTEFYLEGTARFASSSEFIMTKDDPPCCSEGFTIIKLGMSLGLAKTPEPIEGVVAHEIAHRVLDSIRKGHVNCNAERRANRLIVKWGFKKEFKEASQLFGQKKGDPAGCQETPDKGES